MIKIKVITHLVDEVEHLLRQANEGDNPSIVTNSLVQSRLILLKIQDYILDEDNQQLENSFNKYCVEFEAFNDEAIKFISEPLFHNYEKFDKRLVRFLSQSSELKAVL